MDAQTYTYAGLTGTGTTEPILFNRGGNFACLQLTGTFGAGGKLEVQGAIDGVNFFVLHHLSQGGDQPIALFNAPGIWDLSVAKYTRLRYVDLTDVDAILAIN